MSRAKQWHARPLAALVVKAVILLVPVLAGTIAGLALARTVTPPADVLPRLGWSVLVLGASTVVLLAVERVVRRLSPLALLLRLSLAFPDEAPRRFGVALRAIRPHRRSAGERAEATTSLALLASLLAHDRRTRGHSERVAAYATMIADELGLARADRDRLTWAALLHDIGKLEVPARILNKPSSLDDAEWKVMATHPAAGGALVAPLRPWLGDALRAVDGHHERFDGGGYPGRVPAGELPLAARITAVADAFETMTAARSYKEPKPIAEARAEVAACSGSHFDPEVCRAFLALSVPRLWRVAGPMSWLAQVPCIGLLVRGDVVPVALGTAAQSAAAASTQAVAAAAVMGGVLVAGSATGLAAVPSATPAAVVTDAPPAALATGAEDSSPVATDPTAVSAHADGPRGAGASGSSGQAPADDLTPLAATDEDPAAAAAPDAEAPGNSGGNGNGNGHDDDNSGQGHGGGQGSGQGHGGGNPNPGGGGQGGGNPNPGGGQGGGTPNPGGGGQGGGNPNPGGGGQGGGTPNPGGGGQGGGNPNPGGGGQGHGQGHGHDDDEDAAA